MNIITIGLILTSVTLVALVLLQDRSSGVGGAFGGGGGGGTTQKRRGAEKILFNATIVIVIIFALLAIWNLFSHQQREESVTPQQMEEGAEIEFGAEDIEVETESGEPVGVSPNPEENSE